MKIPKNSLVVGSPGKVVRQVKDFEREMILERPQEYIDLAAIYLNAS
jgi:carbonic anhydrase/acetyltransferase-like protein (isoleucine patch superfamily)